MNSSACKIYILKYKVIDLIQKKKGGVGPKYFDLSGVVGNSKPVKLPNPVKLRAIGSKSSWDIVR